MAPLAPRLLELRARVANLLGPRELQVRCLEALLEVTTHSAPARLGAEVDLFWALTRIGDVARAEEVGREVLELARQLSGGKRRMRRDPSGRCEMGRIDAS